MESSLPVSEARVVSHGLSIDPSLKHFVDQEVLAGIGIASDSFWSAMSDLVAEFAPQNQELLDLRDDMQAAIDSWYRENAESFHPDRYVEYLRKIGYIEDEIDLAHEPPGPHDPEIGEVSGPQLVVPVTNARYTLNALNSRWGSLYDAVYGTDVLGDRSPPDQAYDPVRGARVVEWCRDFLDSVFPLKEGSHSEVTAYSVVDGRLQAELSNPKNVSLKDPDHFAGFTGDPSDPSSVVLVNHGLHVRIAFDREHPIGASDSAGISDIVLEAAVTTIVDFEDSVATVDAAEKVVAYRNWLGIMKGDLEVEVVKGPRRFTRRLEADQEIIRPDGSTDTLPGRSLAMVRNVGMHLRTDAILDGDAKPIPEEYLDVMVTVACSLHDIRSKGRLTNSRAGLVYIVKPKLHGSDEVAYTERVLSHAERALGLASGTIRLGVMDEERRTSVNLANCIKRARGRLAFINTGFLDRTGDEIHTSMYAGPVVRKGDMKSQSWIHAYEQRNVAIGLSAGLMGRAQIGKGMWAKPDHLAEMLEQKIEHPRAGANCAWVPSPTAATLHAIHYHTIDVAARQRELATEPPADISDLLEIPVQAQAWSDAERLAELENNLQSILGYVVRWIDQGIGCSTVPDINGVGLMEDRATCRISSQHLANWVVHGITTEEEVRETMTRLASVVDNQNSLDASYRPLTQGFDGPAFSAALELVLDGLAQPNGYIDWILNERRRQRKALDTTLRL